MIKRFQIETDNEGTTLHYKYFKTGNNPHFIVTYLVDYDQGLLDPILEELNGMLSLLYKTGLQLIREGMEVCKKLDTSGHCGNNSDLICNSRVIPSFKLKYSVKFGMIFITSWDYPFYPFFPDKNITVEENKKKLDEITEKKNK